MRFRQIDPFLLHLGTFSINLKKPFLKIFSRKKVMTFKKFSGTVIPGYPPLSLSLSFSLSLSPPPRSRRAGSKAYHPRSSKMTSERFSQVAIAWN